MITTDFYGKTVSEGVKVAFNYQGECRRGVVIRIDPRTQYGQTHRWPHEPYLTIHIEHETGPRRVSKVTNRKNLVVI